MELQIAGHLDLAERLYRSILSAQPGHAGAHHGLGLLEIRLRRPADGVPHLLAALEARPESPDYWLGYLEGLRLTGDVAAAAAALALGREHGLSGKSVDDFAQRLQAPAAAPQSVETQPPRAERRRRLRERRAAEASETALLRVFVEGNFAAAFDDARALTQSFPNRGLGWKVLGALLAANGKTDEAVAAMRVAIRLLPEDAEAHTNLAVTLSQKQQRHAEAERLLQRALGIDPQFQAAYLAFGDSLQMQGRYEDAEDMVGRAIALPADATNPSNSHYTSWVFLLSHNPSVGADTLFAAHRRAAARLESRALPATRHANSADPARRLKVGFVSADLYEHPVAQFIEPVLAHLGGRPGLEIHAYYNNTFQDATTLRLRRHFSHWHPVATLTDAELAKHITTDGIDVIIDLSGHTTMNRLGALAYKPAPIQVSWLGYPGTTGLHAMDYYLADRHLLPPGLLDAQFTEKLVFLPAAGPFPRLPASPMVGSLPAMDTGNLTFGSFNRRGKINQSTIRLWSELLRALPATRLLIAGVSLKDDAPNLTARLAHEGIDSARLTFHPRCPMDPYLALHHRVDMCLDTYPYNGGTTTINALWMGVPTLTIAGATPAARQGASILGQLGLGEFAAADAAEFVIKGVQWAGRLHELAELRASLRDRWQASPAGQPAIIADALEHALRRMWTRWCAGLPPESF
jgi:predicted O-linked N-acetylglucosamine transferase (SPINDLY family)